MIIEVFAQAYENKSDTGVPNWIPKGERLFHLEVDRKDEMKVLYEDGLVDNLTDYITAQSNSLYRYEFRDYTIRFHDVIKGKFVPGGYSSEVDPAGGSGLNSHV